jgi:hypothetical protein
MFKADCRRLGSPQLAAGKQPPMTGDNLEVGVDQNRDIESEGLDAAGDLPDLLAGVLTGVGRIEPQPLSHRAVKVK